MYDVIARNPLFVLVTGDVSARAANKKGPCVGIFFIISTFGEL